MPDIPSEAELVAAKSKVEDAVFVAVPEARVLCVAVGAELVGSPPLYQLTGNGAIRVYVPDASDGGRRSLPWRRAGPQA